MGCLSLNLPPICEEALVLHDAWHCIYKVLEDRHTDSFPAKTPHIFLDHNN